MSNLLARILSGIVLILIVFGTIWLNEYSLLALVLVIYALGLNEFRQIFRSTSKVTFLSTQLAGLISIVFAYLFIAGNFNPHLLTLLAAGYLLFTIQYLFHSKISRWMSGNYLFAFLWLSASLILFMLLGWNDNNHSYDPLYLTILIGIIWVFDIGAYITGSLIGKTMISPSISPGKSVEGLFGGIIITCAAGYLAYMTLGEFSFTEWIILSVTIGLGATAGDLLESKMKRESGVKDSGKTIPGHGGILDRFDSLFFSAPLFYIIVQLFKIL
jgi:phosphatidate cytidylyltransferase